MSREKATNGAGCADGAVMIAVGVVDEEISRRGSGGRTRPMRPGPGCDDRACPSLPAQHEEEQHQTAETGKEG